MTKVFEENLALWSKERPVEAFRLRQIEGKGYRFFKNKDGSQNLKTPFGNLYSENPQREAKEWFQKLPLAETKLLFVYGIGLGNYYQELKKWLREDPSRHVIFFDDDLVILKKFFEQDIATEILNDQQATICYLKNSKDEDGVLETLYWSFVLTPYLITSLKSYEQYRENSFQDFKFKISYSTTMKNALVDEYLTYGVAFFRNFYPNILQLHTSYWGNSLFGKFQGVPAIICGAGPSLEKQISRLGTLKNKAIIFAGGSSLNAISNAGVLPHFGAGIDPNPTQFTRLTSNKAFEVPFFYRSRVLAEAFKHMRGPRLYISGAGGYDVSEWYEEKFGLQAEFLDEGHNVVNFCTEIATRMGCNPLIYIGMDLAYTGMKAYSAGIEENVDVSHETLLTSKDEEKRAVERKDIYGKPILTLWKWIGEADWLGDFAKNHEGLTMINCTEGGIGFPGIKAIPFQEAINDYLNQSFDLQGRVHGEIENSTISNITSHKVEEATEELSNSLKRVIQFIDTILDAIKKRLAEPFNGNENLSGSAALAETELYEEPAYKYIIDVFHQVFARVQSKKIKELRLNKKETLTTAEIAKGKWELMREKLQFMRDVAEANKVLIEYARKEK